MNIENKKHTTIYNGVFNKNNNITDEKRLLN